MVSAALPPAVGAGPPVGLPVEQGTAGRVLIDRLGERLDLHDALPAGRDGRRQLFPGDELEVGTVAVVAAEPDDPAAFEDLVHARRNLHDETPQLKNRFEAVNPSI